jgi:galactonate dehydratase
VKIANISTIVVGAPWRDLVFAELETDDGRVGVGEVRPVNKVDTVVAAIHEFGKRYLVGADPFNVEMFGWNMRRGDYGRPGEVVASAAAALEIACWDLMGQALGEPVYRLLGGQVRDRVPAYANGWYQSERDPDAFAALAQRVLDRGYRAMKVDPFGSAFGEISAAERRLSLAIVAAIRERIGPDIGLMIEMHGRFTAGEAATLAKDLEPMRPMWIEEPVPPENAAALRRVRSATHLPIATGERIHAIEDVLPFLELGVVDVVQVDLTHFGGLLPMKNLAAMVDAHYLTMAPHNVCGPVGTMANIHLAIATPAFRILEHFNDFADPWVRDLVDVAPTVDQADGAFGVPSGTGLGLKLDRAACAQYPARGKQIRLFQPGWEQRIDNSAETRSGDSA